jgi:hypothetical protein
MLDDEWDITDGETTYIEHNSPYGAASHTQQDISSILKRPVSKKTTNWANAVTRDSSTEALQLQVKQVVEKLGLQRKAVLIEQEATKLRASGMKVQDAVYAATAQVLQESGWNIRRIAQTLGEMNRKLLRVKDLVITIIPEASNCLRADNHASNCWHANNHTVSVLINGEQREAKLFNYNGKLKLRIKLYETDNGKVLEVRGAKLAAVPAQEKWVSPDERRRLKVLDEHRGILTTDESFELFRLMKQAGFVRKASVRPEPSTRLNAIWYTCSVDKLPLTKMIAQEAGILQKIQLLYAKKLKEKLDASGFNKRLEKVKDGESYTKTPRLLAEEALLEADAEVWQTLPWHTKSCIRRLALMRCNKSDLKTVGLSGAVVRSELKGWRR